MLKCSKGITYGYAALHMHALGAYKEEAAHVIIARPVTKGIQLQLKSLGTSSRKWWAADWALLITNGLEARTSYGQALGNASNSPFDSADQG